MLRKMQPRTHAPDAQREHADSSRRIPPSVWKVAAVVSIGSFMAQMDSTLVAVSLSTIGRALDAPVATAQWIVSGYLLAMALMLPLNGWLVDRIGAKRLSLSVRLLDFHARLHAVRRGARHGRTDRRTHLPGTRRRRARAHGADDDRPRGGQEYRARNGLRDPAHPARPHPRPRARRRGARARVVALALSRQRAGRHARRRIGGPAASSRSRPAAAAPFRFHGFRVDLARAGRARLRTPERPPPARPGIFARRHRAACGVRAALATPRSFSAYRRAHVCGPEVRGPGHHPVSGQRHPVRATACRSAIPHRRLRVLRRARGLAPRLHGRGHDGLVRLHRLPDRAPRLPRARCGRRVTGPARHDTVPVDDGPRVFHRPCAGQPVPRRRGSGNHQHSFDFGRVCGDAESAASRGEHGIEHRAKNGRSGRDHARLHRCSRVVPGSSGAQPQQFLPAFATLCGLHLLCFAAAMRLPARVRRASEG
ncbi:Major Facilitator Superfamily protein [Paraburkholderia lycopersici]|uniref:Major Facilitator Superfamily protein n=1 Tax=Paraburkholderia lycopersici TaxID=416944 RepID=A0A1G6TLI8_9BURK|nr:Major Facilitator Superfamily protein [Paraburkholderia lycopersici]